MMKLVILGAGLQGNICCTDLCDRELSPGEKEIVIADYDFAKAKDVADRFGLKAVQLDVRDHDKLIEVINGADVVLNCVQYNWNIDIMNACLEVHAHYIDLGGLFHVTKKQLELNDRFREAGLTAVLGMGSTPGTMNVMAGYAASQLDTIEEAKAICACGDFTKTDAVIGIPYSLLTVMEEHTLEPWILRDGELVPVPAGSGKETIAFSEPIGAADAFYCIHSEPVQFASSFRDKGIKNASFKLSLPAGFEERISFLADLGFASEEPVVAAGQEVNPLRTMVSVVNRYLKRYDSSNDGELNDCDVLRAEVTGNAALSSRFPQSWAKAFGLKRCLDSFEQIVVFVVSRKLRILRLDSVCALEQEACLACLDHADIIVAVAACDSFEADRLQSLYCSVL